LTPDSRVTPINP